MDQKTRDVIQKIAGSPDPKLVAAGKKLINAAMKNGENFTRSGGPRTGLPQLSSARDRALERIGQAGNLDAHRARAKTGSAHERTYIEGHRATPSRDIGATILDDFIKGAQRNPRLGHIQYDGVHTTDMTALEIAKVAGQLQALAEAEFTLKEASETLNLPEATLQAVLEAVK